jgi:HEAT repeat protein
MLWWTTRKLRSPDEYVRREAASELGLSGSPRALTPLCAALHDPERSVREAVAEALGEIGDNHATAALLSILNDPAAPVAKAAAKALGQIRDPAALEPLIRALLQGNSELHWDIEQALTAIDSHWTTTPAARAAIEDGMDRLQTRATHLRQAAARTLCSIGDARAVDVLILALKDPDPTVRLWSVRALGRLDGPRAVTALLEVLQDKDYLVRDEAATALGRIGNPRATQALIACLGSVPAAAVALGEIGDTEALVPLIRYYPEQRTDVSYRNNPHAPQELKGQVSVPIEALEKILQRSAASASIEDLLVAASLEDLQHHIRVDYDTPGYGDGADEYTITIDLAKVRRLAAEELERRSATPRD